MAGVSVPYGFELPLGIENVSIALLNRNFTKINDALKAIELISGNVKFDTAAVTSKNSAYDGTASTFYKIRIGDKNRALIVADIRLKFLGSTAFTTPDYQDTAVAPPKGFKFRESSGVTNAIATGQGANYSCQMQLQGGVSGTVQIRREPASSANRIKDTVASGIFIGEWNGLTT